VGDPVVGPGAPVAALAPALLFAFLFNNLVVATRRKIERAARGSGSVPPVAPAVHPLDAGPRSE
jgi:hypothetical protein